MASEVTCQLLENASARFEQITAELMKSWEWPVVVLMT